MAEINTAEQLEREIAYVATCLTSMTSADRLRRAHGAIRTHERQLEDAIKREAGLAQGVVNDYRR